MKAFLITAALLCALCPLAQAADTTPAKPPVASKPAAIANPTSPAATPLTPAELAAKADLQKMADILKSSTGLTYTAKITLLSPQSPTATPSASTPAKDYDSTVTVEKPGKIALTVSPMGTGQEQIYDDGANVTVFDSGSSKYSTAPGAANFSGSIGGLFRADQAVYPSTPEALMTLQQMLAFPLDYSIGQFVSGPVPAGLKFTITEDKETVDGKAVNKITQQYKMTQITVAVAYAVDPTTNLPVEFSEDASTAEGKKVLSLHEWFTNFQVLAGPAVASTYTFTPPAGAALVAAAAPPAPQASKLLTVGAKAPDFTVNSVKGTPVKLSDFAGKVVVVDFWATWCGPCQASLPHTDSIAKTFKAKGVVFLPICTWDQKPAFTTWQKAHAAWTMSFYFDPAAGNEGSSIASKLYGVDGIPTQYVIGKDGKVAYSTVGYDEQNDPKESELVKALNKAL